MRNHISLDCCYTFFSVYKTLHDIFISKERHLKKVFGVKIYLLKHFPKVDPSSAPADVMEVKRKPLWSRDAEGLKHIRCERTNVEHTFWRSRSRQSTLCKGCRSRSRNNIMRLHNIGPVNLKMLILLWNMGTSTGTVLIVRCP
jgi:hypothetical protein